MIDLGRKYKDKITGFEGVATGYVIYISGCNQALLSPQIRDGKVEECRWFDEQRLDQIGDEKIVLDNSNSPGFDIEAPRR
jgi:hypothetical protein